MQSAESAAVQRPTQDRTKRKPWNLKRLWRKAGLDATTLQLMFKGSLPPSIAIAMYQGRSIQDTFGTLGYLVAISSLLGFAILPRGKFIQSMIVNVITICIATAVNLLALFCVTQARIHTTSPTPPTQDVTYNASASTVCAIWLIFQTYIINVGRAARPQFQFPAVLCSIFGGLSMTNGVLFPTMPAAVSFMKRLLEAFLTGFALATGVSLFVFPMTSRKVVFKEMAQYLRLLIDCLNVQTAYIGSLDTVQAPQLQEEHKQTVQSAKESNSTKDQKPPAVVEASALCKLRQVQDKIVELHGKLDSNVTLAKREIALGKLDARHIDQLWKLIRLVFLPVVGLWSMIPMLEHQLEEQESITMIVTGEEPKQRHSQLDNSRLLLKKLHEPFYLTAAIVSDAFQHVLLTLELVQPGENSYSDEESTVDQPAKPGTPGFAEACRRKVDDFYVSKQKTLEDWCRQHAIELPSDSFRSSFLRPKEVAPKQEEEQHPHQRRQRQLLFILHMEYLLWRVCVSVLDMVIYVDKSKQDGVFDTSKVIFPSSKTLSKWIKSTWTRSDLSEDDPYTADVDLGGAQFLDLGEKFGKKRDPEHFPPRNRMEKVGDALRLVPSFFRSEESRFGLRVATATITIAIVCYLPNTQTFFLRQRLRWAMNTVAMSMNRTAGQSSLNFALRVLGTAIATVASYLVWYIVDGKTPGVIILLWLWIFLAFYMVVKRPKFTIATIISINTVLLIIGYELQVETIGVQASEQSGQPAYPTYELAPYRLAAVAGGLLVAFFWTIFPYPISESSELRKDISASLYMLSLYYTVTHETVKVRVLNTAGDENVKGTRAYNLMKARHSVFTKLIHLLASLRKNSAFSKYQVRLGGKFPRHEYEELIGCIRRLSLWMTLASYTSTTLQTSSPDAAGMSPESGQATSKADASSKRTASLLSFLSSRLIDGQPLPQALDMPEPCHFVQHLDSTNYDVLGIRHMREPEISALAVMQVIPQCINTDVEKLVTHLKKLVGEVDISLDGLDRGFTSSKSSNKN